MRELLQRVDLANILVACAGEEIIGFVRLTWWPGDSGTWVYLHIGCVVPAWRGRGLGTGMLHWAEERLRTLASSNPDVENWEYAANPSGIKTSSTELLLYEGYYQAWTGVIYELYDLANLPQANFDAEYRVSTIRPELYRTLWEVQHNEFWADQSAFGIEVMDEAAYQEYLADFEQGRVDPTLWYLLFADERPVATVQTHIGVIDEVGTHPDYQRKGLARSLILHAPHRLRERGVTHVSISTAERNHRARPLYEKLGFQLVKTLPRYRKQA
jgi:mycothiol synthase